MQVDSIDTSLGSEVAGRMPPHATINAYENTFLGEWNWFACQALPYRLLDDRQEGAIRPHLATRGRYGSGGVSGHRTSAVNGVVRSATCNASGGGRARL